MTDDLVPDDLVRGQLPLVDRHRAAQLVHELCRPAHAAVIAQLPPQPGMSIPAVTVQQQVELSIKEFWTAVSRLESAGVIERDADRLALARDQLDRVTDRWVADSPLHAVITAHPRIAPFVQWGRITRMPTDPGLLDEVYAGLAELFVPGETLSEVAVNARITVVHDDPADVRRALVDRGLLRRTPGTAVYRRPDRAPLDAEP